MASARRWATRFGALIAGDDASARDQAAAVRSRMATLVDGLPPQAPLAPADAAVRNAVESSAGLMSAVADDLDPPSGAFDRQRALQDGPTTLDIFDKAMSSTEPGSTVVLACPAVAYVAAPVSFPPPPSRCGGVPITGQSRRIPITVHGRRTGAGH